MSYLDTLIFLLANILKNPDTQKNIGKYLLICKSILKVHTGTEMHSGTDCALKIVLAEKEKTGTGLSEQMG